MYGTIRDKITSRIDVVDAGYLTPCWISNRSEHTNGYTKLGVDGKTLLTHRVAYEEWRGEIPDGLVIDHLCRNRKCCNPDHLEPVTHQVNLLRGETLTAREAAQTHCLRGHPFDAINTYRSPSKPDIRECRACRADSSRAQKERRRQSTS